MTIGGRMRGDDWTHKEEPKVQSTTVKLREDTYHDLKAYRDRLPFTPSMTELVNTALKSWLYRQEENEKLCKE